MNPSLALPRLEVPSLPTVVLRPGHRLARLADGLSLAQRRLVTCGIVVAHGFAIWGVLQAQTVPEAPVDAGSPAPVFVSLIAPPAPAVQAAPKPQVMPKTPVPVARPVVAAPSTRPTEFVAAAPVERREIAPTPAAVKAQEAAPVAPAAPVVQDAPAVAAVPAAPPGPVVLPSSAVQYLKKVEPEYPNVSRRLGEAGRVMLRVTIDEGGLPREVRVSHSSGFSRLDESALAAVRQWRFKPHVLNGNATVAVANIPLDFELER